MISTTPRMILINQPGIFKNPLFGASAPAGLLFKEYGFTAENGATFLQSVYEPTFTPNAGG